MDLILETLQLLAFAKISEEILDEIDLNKKEALDLMGLLSEDELQLLYQIGLIAKRDMELAPSLSGGFDMALLRMVSFIPNELTETKKKANSKDLNENTISQETQIEEKAGIDQQSSMGIMKEESKPQLEPEPDQENGQELVPESKLEIELNITSKNWKETFDQLNLDPGTKQLASHCYFVKSDESVIYLSMPDEKLNVFSGKHRKQLQDALTDFFGFQCNLFLEAGGYSKDSPNEIKEKEKRKDLINAKKEIDEDPNVQSLVEAFGAKVIESSVEPRTEK